MTPRCGVSFGRPGTGFVLVRPDGHVAWRGTAPPSDPLRIADLVRGAGG
ncbi:aromatic-ring hydroxylase C-terminal domain-containing protein [Streptomyces sp. NPDC055103]